MPSIALFHAQTEFANQLATTVESIDNRYSVEVFSQSPSRTTRIRRALAGDFDLIQVDEALRNGLLGVGIRTVKGTPLVLCFRGWADYTNAHGQYSRTRNWSIVRRTSLVLRNVDEVVYLSEATRRHMRDRYEAPVGRLVDRPFNTDVYRDGTPAADVSNGPCILTVTNLRYKQKLAGVLDSLSALADVFTQRDNVKYVIAGGGKYLDPLRDHVDEYPYSNRVRVVGFRTDIPDLLAAADIFLYVSHLDAFPMAVLEAQAAGIPVIGGNKGGVPEAVGDAGVVSEINPKALANVVMELISDAERRAELSRRGREKMAQYNEVAARGYIEVWESLLEDPPS